MIEQASSVSQRDLMPSSRSRQDAANNVGVLPRNLLIYQQIPREGAQSRAAGRVE